METLGKRIKRIRKSLNLNQADFAIKLGLESAVAVSNYENDQRTPDKNKLIIISELGNISIDELLTGVESLKAVKEENQPTEVVKGMYQSEFRVSEALTMCAHVLESGTSYATALYLNIQHFDRAVTAESRMATLEAKQQDFEIKMSEEIQTLKHNFETLQAENRTLRTENNRLISTNEALKDGDSGHLASDTEKKAM